MLHFIYGILNMTDINSTYWRMDFQDTGKFFRDATQRLCGTLDLEVALGAFFDFLRDSMGVTGMMIGRILFDAHVSEGIAWCDGDGVQLSNRRIMFTPEQARLADTALRHRGEAEDGVYAATLDDPVARFLCTQSSRAMQPPLFFLRMRSGKDFWAGVAFTCPAERPFTPEQLEQLRSLRAPLLMTLSNCLRYRELEELKEYVVRENFQLRSQLGRAPDMDIVGAGGSLARVVEEARLAGATDVPVLIVGETGAGKEVIAHAVHGFSRRMGAPFVAVNCGAIPASLIDSELFGHARGAFTGAVQEHKGYFERAHGGTIFLDEIGELPLEAQARLLRVLQDKKIERVGGGVPIPVDFRLIAATNRDLKKMAAEGAFREDLYYRLRVVLLEVPPLRERKEDIPLLTTRFIQDAARRFGIVPPLPAPGEVGRLTAYAWPGNVRELRNVVEEAMVLAPQGPLRFRLHEENGGAALSLSGGMGLPGEAGENTALSSDAWPTLDELHARY